MYVSLINWKVMQVLKWSSTVSLCFFYQCWHIPTQAPPLSVSDTPPGVKSQRVTERRCYLNNDWWHHTSHVGHPSSPRCLHPLYLQNLDKPTQTEKLENDGTLSYTKWLFPPKPNNCSLNISVHTVSHRDCKAIQTTGCSRGGFDRGNTDF